MHDRRLPYGLRAERVGWLVRLQCYLRRRQEEEKIKEVDLKVLQF